MKVGVWKGGLGPHQPFHSGSSCHPGGPNFLAPMISAPIPTSCCRAKASSMPPVLPGWPALSFHQRVVNSHSCSRSPAWPNGSSRLWPSPVPKPSSEIEKCWTRVSDTADAPFRSQRSDRGGDAEQQVGRGIRVIADPGSAACSSTLMVMKTRAIRPSRASGAGVAAPPPFLRVVAGLAVLTQTLPRPSMVISQQPSGEMWLRSVCRVRDPSTSTRINSGPMMSRRRLEAQPQATVGPARRLGHGQAVEQYAGLHGLSLGFAVIDTDATGGEHSSVGAHRASRRPDRLRMGTRSAGGIHSATDEVPGLYLPFALDRDRPPWLADELVPEQLLRRSGDLDPARGPVGLHPTRGVHGIAPKVVQEPLPADHAGHNR